MISKCRESSGANTKKYLKYTSKFSVICQKHKNPLTTVFKKKIKNQEKKDFADKDNILTLNNQVKSNKSEILVLDHMIE